MTRFPRSSGVLAHVTSLPSEFGVGDLGPDAFAFVDFLANAGQGIWQVLPLNPPARGNSPYSCYSVFANASILISPSVLVDESWLDSLPARTHQAERVDFHNAMQLKQHVLQQAFDASLDRLDEHEEFNTFCHSQAWWLNDFARFEVMMREFGSSDWTTWDASLARRDDAALAGWDARRDHEMKFSKFVQFLLDQQWGRLKQYANEKGVRMYGDLSIFVASDSADVWANQHLFHLDADGNPSLVSGVPPDYFSETGQLWGNPLYRWDVMEENNFAWWTKRFHRAQQQFDLLRVDHFRGFESYWEIPASAATAVEGQWQPGPGRKPFDAARESLGELPIIAEDLGLITEAVHQLRDELGFPPMRVLQFGFESEHDDFHRPDQYPEHCVAYTGTHDNNTTMGWYRERQRNGSTELIDKWIDTNQEIHTELNRLVLESKADTAILPLQDWIGLGSESRMNTPGTVDGNWLWRVNPDDLTPTLADQVCELTRHANR